MIEIVSDGAEVSNLCLVGRTLSGPRLPRRDGMRRILVVSTVLAVTAVGLAPSVTASPTSSPAHAGASASSVPTITPNSLYELELYAVR